MSNFGEISPVKCLVRFKCVSTSNVQSKITMLNTIESLSSPLPGGILNPSLKSWDLVLAWFVQSLTLKTTSLYGIQLQETPKELPNGKFFSRCGHDLRLDDCKIVRDSISTYTNIIELKVEVLTLKSNTWRTIQDLESSVAIQGAGTYANGVLSWLAQKESVPNKKLVTVSFDLNSWRRFRVDELPRCKYWVDLVYVTERGNVLMEGT
ncbi:hypothetical protein POTOM_002464 [Populus tomentosa]|uniref:Uncharacterized protein n=1 Tax=Populus tomentosa TaxID=118781 RepID=A0A8X8DJY9_POPTO|nr:hypothetical protein POTOM_002464 [Populus tomentosa]